MSLVKEAEETTLIESRRAPVRSRLPFLAAGFLALLCACGAFLVLVLSDHGHTRLMVHDQAATSLKTPRLTSTNTQPLPATAQSNAAEKVAPTANPFRLEVGRKAAVVGPLRLRLIRTDPRNSVYDIAVLFGRRSFSHRHLRLNDPVWISLGSGRGAMQIIVTAIENRTVRGTWIETEHSPEITSHRGRKR